MKIFPIIKCVGVSCNLRCSYCYHSESDQSVNAHTVMPLDVVERLISQTIEVNNGFCHCLWHGGEPLLAGLNFFNHVVIIQKKFIARGARITNSIQTNGTLITTKWAEFFRDNHFRVGISIDGPTQIHNRYRKDTRNRGSFNSVMRGIKTCQQNDCDVGIIAAVTSYSAQFPKEMYSFFISNGIKKISFNPVYEVDSLGRLYPYSVDDRSFGDFLSAIFNMWIEEDDPDAVIRQFTDPLTKMCGGSVSTCIFAGSCSKFLEIYGDGAIKPCHGFKTQVLGNITEQTIREMFTGDPYQKLLHATQKLPTNCVSCEWLSVCNGGCCDHRNTEFSSVGSDSYVFCNSRKRIFSLLKEFVADHQ